MAAKAGTLIDESGSQLGQVDYRLNADQRGRIRGHPGLDLFRLWERTARLTILTEDGERIVVRIFDKLPDGWWSVAPASRA
jgi:hypothetical protein